MKNERREYIASCSGGQDSVATLITAKEHDEPIDEVVYCEVMFDKDVSGEHPEHTEFVYCKLKPFVENELGVPFRILRSEKTYVDVFTHIITRGENTGRQYGFAYPRMCAINRDLKIPPIKQYWKSKEGVDVTQYVGITYDEQERLMRMYGTNRVSLLNKYKISRVDAARLCIKYGMHSPCYQFSNRNGCWFCPNCKDSEWAHLIFNHESLFDRLIDLECQFSNRARRCLTVNETPSELKRRIMYYGEQMKLDSL